MNNTKKSCVQGCAEITKEGKIQNMDKWQK
jgi:hypothetical protein